MDGMTPISHDLTLLALTPPLSHLSSHPLFSVSSGTANGGDLRLSCSSRRCRFPEEVQAQSYTTGPSLQRHINLLLVAKISPLMSSSWVSACCCFTRTFFRGCACVCDYVHACVGGQGNWSSECARVCSGQAMPQCTYSAVLCWAVGVWESDQSGLQRELRKNEEIADR